MIAQEIKAEAGFFINEKDWFELKTLFNAMLGEGELILYCGDETFLPEIRSENMASILMSRAQHGQRLMKNGRPG